MKKESAATGGAVLAAIGASLCCVGPFLAVAFGVGAFGAAAVFESARPYLLAAAALALAFGFYRAYFRRKACAPGEAYAATPISRAARPNLWLASIAVLIFASFPYYVGTLARHLTANGGDAGGQPVARPAAARETFKVSGMTCAGCETTIKLALEQTPGVRGAEVSYDRGEAVVEFDPSLTGAGELRAAINETGYTCELPK